jgi:hypothetical protein
MKLFEFYTGFKQAAIDNLLKDGYISGLVVLKLDEQEIDLSKCEDDPNNIKHNVTIQYFTENNLPETDTGIIKVNSNLLLIPMFFSDDADKKSKIESLKRSVQFYNIKEYIVISDGYFRKIGSLSDLNYTIKNWDLEKPSLYPDSMRSEAVITIYKNKHGGMLDMMEYKKDPMKIVSYENTTNSKFADSVFPNLFE